MSKVLEVEDHPLPPDTWGEAPQSLVTTDEQVASSTGPPTTAAPNVP